MPGDPTLPRKLAAEPSYSIGTDSERIRSEIRPPPVVIPRHRSASEPAMCVRSMQSAREAARISPGKATAAPLSDLFTDGIVRYLTTLSESLGPDEPPSLAHVAWCDAAAVESFSDPLARDVVFQMCFSARSEHPRLFPYFAAESDGLEMGEAVESCGACPPPEPERRTAHEVPALADATLRRSKLCSGFAFAAWGFWVKGRIRSDSAGSRPTVWA
jgi:hypothetical protein